MKRKFLGSYRGSEPPGEGDASARPATPLPREEGVAERYELLAAEKEQRLAQVDRLLVRLLRIVERAKGRRRRLLHDSDFKLSKGEELTYRRALERQRGRNAARAMRL